MTTVSVALCTFNGQRFLDEQLSSLAAQSRLPDELVIRDDQSHDQTLKVLREFARRAPFKVRIVDSDAHLGVAAAFSILSTFCTSDVILYCDQDDVWDRRKIEKSVGVLNEGPWWAVASDAELVNERLDSLGATLWSNTWLSKQPSIGDNLFSRLLLQGNIVAGMSLAVRREFALAHLPPPSPWLHDGWLALCAAASEKLALIPEPLVKYRQHARNVIGSPRGAIGGFFQHLAAEQQRIVEGDLGRLDALGRSALSDKLRAYESELHARREYLVMRTTLTRSRLLRVPDVVGGLISGRFEKYGAGWRTAVKDMLRTIPR